MGLIDVQGPRDAVLSLRVADDFFVFEHQSLSSFDLILMMLLFRGVVLFPLDGSGNKAVMHCSRSQAAFFQSIGALRVAACFEVVSNLFESFFRDKILPLGAEVAAVDYCVNIGA